MLFRSSLSLSRSLSFSFSLHSLSFILSFVLSRPLSLFLSTSLSTSLYISLSFSLSFSFQDSLAQTPSPAACTIARPSACCARRPLIPRDRCLPFLQYLLHGPPGRAQPWHSRSSPEDLLHSGCSLNGDRIDSGQPRPQRQSHFHVSPRPFKFRPGRVPPCQCQRWRTGRLARSSGHDPRPMARLRPEAKPRWRHRRPPRPGPDATAADSRRRPASGTPPARLQRASGCQGHWYRTRSQGLLEIILAGALRLFRLPRQVGPVRLGMHHWQAGPGQGGRRAIMITQWLGLSNGLRSPRALARPACPLGPGGALQAAAAGPRPGPCRACPGQKARRRPGRLGLRRPGVRMPGWRSDSARGRGPGVPDGGPSESSAGAAGAAAPVFETLGGAQAAQGEDWQPELSLGCALPPGAYMQIANQGNLLRKLECP